MQKPIHTHTIEHRPGELELGEGVFSVHLARVTPRRETEGEDLGSDTGLVAVQIARYKVKLDPKQQEEAIMFLLDSLKAHYGRIPDPLWDRIAEVINA